MGIRGLSTYINQNSPYFLESYRLHDTDLVIDGVNVYCIFYRDTDRDGGRFGGQYDIFAEALKNFFESILLCNIRPIILLDSVDSLSKAHYLRKFQDKLDRTTPAESCTMQHLMKDVFLSVIKSLKIKCVQTIMEADETMVAVAKGLDCPILSQDGDFYIQGTKFIHWNTLIKTPMSAGEGDPKKFWLSCKMYSIKKFCRKFNICDESVLTLGLIILGAKDGRGRLDADMIKPFLELLNSSVCSYLSNFHQQKIDRMFQWLSKFSSLPAAVASLLSSIDFKHRAAVCEDIEKAIGELGFGSPLVLRALELPKDVFLKILEANDKQLLTATEIAVWKPKHIKTLQFKNGRMMDDYIFSEQEIIDISPKWFMDHLIQAKVRALPIEMMMFSVAVVKSLNDTSGYPPTCVASIPILQAMYSLVCSLRDKAKDILEVYYAKDNKIVKQVMTVEASTVDFRNIKDVELEKRKRFIDQALGVEDMEFLDKLPDEWKLYVATIVFWMKQKVLPEKINAHVLSVIMAMMIGVIDEKIGVVRSMEKLHMLFGECRPDVLRQNEDRQREIKGLELKEVLKMVTKDECIAAAPFFIDFFKPGLYVEYTSGKIVHTFGQFHICLKNAIMLNCMLDYPYVEVLMHRVFNGRLFYKLFEMFSTRKDVDSYVAEKLEGSPALVKIFMMLKDMVLGILNKTN